MVEDLWAARDPEVVSWMGRRSAAFWVATQRKGAPMVYGSKGKT